MLTFQLIDDILHVNNEFKLGRFHFIVMSRLIKLPITQNNRSVEPYTKHCSVIN